MNFLTDIFSCRFRDDLIVASSSDCLAGAPEEVGCCSLEENLGLLLRAEFLSLALTCLEAIDPISVILGRSIMFTILEGLKIFSRPSILQEYLSSFGGLTCFGVTVKFFMSKSYCEISEMESAVRTLDASSSAPSSISLAYR